ncbi:hypothetical protein BC567DRAFT_231101 [Phyllosticta citribraziliensis]
MALVLLLLLGLLRLLVWLMVDLGLRLCLVGRECVGGLWLVEMLCMLVVMVVHGWVEMVGKGLVVVVGGLRERRRGLGGGVLGAWGRKGGGWSSRGGQWCHEARSKRRRAAMAGYQAGVCVGGVDAHAGVLIYV